MNTAVFTFSDPADLAAFITSVAAEFTPEQAFVESSTATAATVRYRLTQHLTRLNACACAIVNVIGGATDSIYTNDGTISTARTVTITDSAGLTFAFNDGSVTGTVSLDNTGAVINSTIGGNTAQVSVSGSGGIVLNSGNQQVRWEDDAGDTQITLTPATQIIDIYVCDSGTGDETTLSVDGTGYTFYTDTGRFGFESLEAYDNDAAAGVGGRLTGHLWQTSPTNTLSLPAGVVMVKQ